MSIFSCLLYLFVIKNQGILKWLYANLKSALLPVVLVYFIVRFFLQSKSYPTEYLQYVYVGISYLVLTHTIPEKISNWFYIEQQRGTLEIIAITRLGVMGLIRFSFLIYLLMFLLIEAPIFVIIAKVILGINLSLYVNGIFLLFVLFNILLSFGLSLISISYILFFRKEAIFAKSRNYIYNLFSGAYCSINSFPLFMKVAAYVLPFTHGIIILRNMVTRKENVFLFLGIFAVYAIVTVVLGHFFMKKTLVYIMKKRSFASYE